ncbi:hypothetical protein ACIOC2_13445 [Streptomyces sp. NPDC088337]|uniref:hypothetical protein n=1 Tax=unclassified Streptomyces TaxID=2593676 RepID=UPI002DDAAF21|nr:hypothetical protein [Streptomyces sp. NBC_01788]
MAIDDVLRRSLWTRSAGPQWPGEVAGPVRYEPADRFWPAALSSLISRRRGAVSSRSRRGHCWPGTAG